MNRLLYVMPFTPDIETMKAYYRDTVGLHVRNESPFFVQFDNGSNGASFALLMVHSWQEQETELCFEAPHLDEEVEALKARGVVFLDEPTPRSFGRVVHLRDPEGNLISLLQPTPGLGVARAPGTMTDDPAWQAGMVGALAAGTRTKPAALATAARAPRFSTAIINARDVRAMSEFYREGLRLRLEMDTADWVSFDVGGTTLALHPWGDREQTEGRRRNVTYAFSVGDLRPWADGARKNGVAFHSAPVDRGWGLHVSATDPEGNDLLFREPPPPPDLEEQLAEAFEDDESPQQAAMRKPLKKGVRAVSRVAIKPEYKANGNHRPRKADKAEKAEKAAEGKKRLPVSSVRGAGPDRSRMTPKNTADPKRARARPAIGRLQKSTNQSLTSQKRAVASASKGKPVKRAALERRGKKR